MKIIKCGNVNVTQWAIMFNLKNRERRSSPFHQRFLVIIFGGFWTLHEKCSWLVCSWLIHLLPTCDSHFASQGRPAVCGSETQSKHAPERAHLFGWCSQRKLVSASTPFTLLFVSFVTQLDSDLINGPSTRIWNHRGGLSEPCSAHVGAREAAWCK